MKPVLISLIYLFISGIMVTLSKFSFEKISQYKLDEQIKEKNFAPVLSFCGYMLGIICILAGAYIGPSGMSFKADLLLFVLYSFVGILLMNFSNIVTDKFLLYKFSTKKEIIEDKNVGTAAVHFGIYTATGLIIAACVNGEYGGILSSVVYYVLGMLFLFLFLKIYDKIIPYSIHEELEKDNYAVGIALGGNILAIGIILMKATLGDFSDLRQSMILYFVDLSSIILLLPSLRYILGNLIIRTVNINSEIKNNNIAAGLAEFITVVCFALLIFFMVDFSSVV
ncbi:MAG: DUF350 domain-containing protein [Candidatus Gastranaerophilales bacterium]|nr:DUF350 domain-containing protein [Candidatus Gastranaerophilales bacterium]